MIDNIFIELLNMSYIGSIVIGVVLLLRILLKKLPKKFSYVLWIVPLVRLMIPFSIESVLSLIPVNPEPIPIDIGYAVKPEINTGVANVDYSVNNMLPVPEIVASINPLQILISIGAIIWFVVMMGMIIYGVLSYYKFKKQLIDSTWIEGNIYCSSSIDTPFVIGIAKPKIYLPNSVLKSEQGYILLHEQTHIKRFDHVFRCIAYITLCTHWFNPLVWLSFYLSGKDMEMSCDESVISELGGNVKKEYSQSLLNFTTKKAKLSMSPLAFGEGDTKGRVKNVLNFKKPKAYFIILIAIILVSVSVGLLANPRNNVNETTINGHTYGVVDVLFQSPRYSFTYTEDTAPNFSISSDYMLYSKEGEHDWTQVGGLYETDTKTEELMSWILIKEFLEDRTVELINDTNILYRADTNNDNNVFYLVTETKEHQILVFIGYEAQEGASIRWIFEVEQIEPMELSLSSTELWNYRTEYVGNNSAIGNISSQLQYPKDFDYNGISLQTENQPYGLTIMLQERDNIEEVVADENSDLLNKINACIMFSLVQNLDEVTFSVEGDSIKSKPYVYTRAWAENLVGMDLWEASEDEEAYDNLIIRIKDMVSLGSDVPIDTHIASNDSSLDQAISEEIIDYHTQYGLIGGTPFESHVIFEIDEDETSNETIVYALVLFQSLSTNEVGIEHHSGSHVPCRIRFRNGLNNTYEFIEYWEPRDGSYYATDIRDVFPDDIEDEAIDTQKYITMQVQSIYSQAIETFNVDTDKVINGLLDVIMSSPMESSNPSDYIEAHRIEYRELTYYGDYMTEFIEREQGEDSAGLRGKILEILYEDMNK